MSDYLISFIDILGFKDFVECSEKQGLSRIQHFAEKYQGFKTAVLNSNKAEVSQITLLSDSIVLSTKMSHKDAWIEFFGLICKISEFLLGQGFLFRGGIAKGFISHKDGDVLYGSGFHKAYELESKVANYPRIVLEEQFSILNAENEWEMDVMNDTEYPVQYIQYFREDPDGLMVFDLLNNLRIKTAFFKNGGLDILVNIIKSGLNVKNQQIRAKYKWFLAQELGPLVHRRNFIPIKNYPKVCEDLGLAPNLKGLLDYNYGQT